MIAKYSIGSKWASSISPYAAIMTNIFAWTAKKTPKNFLKIHLCRSWIKSVFYCIINIYNIQIFTFFGTMTK
jgi:hypothetical protein